MTRYKVSLTRGFSDKRVCLRRTTLSGRGYYFFKDQPLNFDTNPIDKKTCIGHAEDIEYFKSDDLFSVAEVGESAKIVDPVKVEPVKVESRASVVSKSSGKKR